MSDNYRPDPSIHRAYGLTFVILVFDENYLAKLSHVFMS